MHDQLLRVSPSYGVCTLQYSEIIILVIHTSYSEIQLHIFQLSPYLKLHCGNLQVVGYTSKFPSLR